MYVVKIFRACIVYQLGIVGVLHTMYLVFFKATAIILSLKIHPTNAGKGNSNIFVCYYPLPLPALVGWIFVVKTIAVALKNTKHMVCNTPTIPSRYMILALQILATYMPQYNKSILPRAKMNTFARTKIASPLEFQCESNALIFSPIGR